MQNNQSQYLDLRRKHPEFIFCGFDISETDETLRFEYRFAIPGLAEFKPRWEIAKLGACAAGASDARLRELVFSLGMVELISYWKLTCSPVVRVECGSLTQEQIDWWKKLYKKGLGEFFYANGIDAGDDFVLIESCEGAGTCRGGPACPPADTARCVHTPKVLIPIGGGKDSAVTLELLRGRADRYCYMLNPRKAMTDTASAGEIPEDKTIIAKRSLDENMLELNRQGYLNGHTPFSALVAFSSVLAAYIHGIGYVALSNESSASEPTVRGSDVNHQYSKSLEFETDFIEYEERCISTGVKYFSLLRPLTELGIAKHFSRFKQYHPVFRSCNAGSKEGKWCASCPKCLFVYIMLSPFLCEEEMKSIFGKNMLEDMALAPLFEKLIGAQPEKPFECVGSRDEVNAALREIMRQLGSRNEPLPALLEHYKTLNIAPARSFDELCGSHDENNHVPERFK